MLKKAMWSLVVQSKFFELIHLWGLHAGMVQIQINFSEVAFKSSTHLCDDFQVYTNVCY